MYCVLFTCSKYLPAVYFNIFSFDYGFTYNAEIFQATNVYWLSSSTYGLMQAFVLQSPKLKRITGVPITAPELEHPYKYFFSRLKSKFRLKKK